MNSKPLLLCWWEVEELLVHLRSRPDLWTELDTPGTWVRDDPRGDTLLQAFVLVLVATKDTTSPNRLTVVQSLPLEWSAEDVDSYLLWLVGHWTSYAQRTVVTQFLIDELKVVPADAPLYAIAIGGMSQEAISQPEPSLPAIQDEFWPKEPIPVPTAFGDPTHLGTFLFE